MPGRTGTRQPPGVRLPRGGVGAGGVRVVGAGGGCPKWVQVSQVHPEALGDPRPGLGKGVQGPCMEQEPPQHPHPVLPSPSPDPHPHPGPRRRPAAPEERMRQRRVTPRVLLLGHLQMGQWDRGQTPLSPTLTPAPRHSLLTHLWVQGCRAVPTPIAAGGSPATLHPWGQSIPRGPWGPAWGSLIGPAPTGCPMHPSSTAHLPSAGPAGSQD